MKSTDDIRYCPDCDTMQEEWEKESYNWFPKTEFLRKKEDGTWICDSCEWEGNRPADEPRGAGRDIDYGAVSCSERQEMDYRDKYYGR